MGSELVAWMPSVIHSLSTTLNMLNIAPKFFLFRSHLQVVLVCTLVYHDRYIKIPGEQNIEAD